MQDEYVREKEESYKKWLEKQSPWFRSKLWQLVVEIKAEQEITGKDTIEIPIGRFRKKNIDLEDTRKLLIHLYCQVPILVDS